MKKTNFAISKLLAEAGFDAETNFCHLECKEFDGSSYTLLSYAPDLDDVDYDAMHYFPSLQ